jgi:hypothetical protein
MAGCGLKKKSSWPAAWICPSSASSRLWVANDAPAVVGAARKNITGRHAPFSASSLPKDFLCKACHDEWHRKVTPQLVGGYHD